MIENKMLVEDIKSTMAMEGFNLDDSDINIMNEYLENKITVDEAVEKIKSEFMM